MNLFKISFVKTLYFNFKYLSLNQALRLPIYIHKKVKFNRLKGRIYLNTPNIKHGMVKIGRKILGNTDCKYTRTILEIDGTISFCGNAVIGQGTKLTVGKNAMLNIGENFCITGGNTTIICNKNITFGNDCLLSWDILMMDTDFHKIYNKDGILINEDRPISIGNNVWIGCRNTILKGVKINNNNVIAANSTITKSINVENCIIGSNAKILKKDINWKG